MRILSLGVLIILTLTAPSWSAADKDRQEKVKEGLRELQEFIGSWKGSGSPKVNPGPRDKFWTENIKWNWRFKGDDCWLAVDFGGGKLFQSAEMRYLPEDNKYRLSALPSGAKKPVVFEGQLKDEKLALERTDEDSGEIQRIRMNTAAEGVRFIYYVDRKKVGGTIWRLEAMVQSTREGESLAKNTKQGPECVVSGGLGTTPVSYMGETFYVCCSGCMQAFKENPKKYVDEFKSKKKK